MCSDGKNGSACILRTILLTRPCMQHPSPAPELFCRRPEPSGMRSREHTGSPCQIPFTAVVSNEEEETMGEALRNNLILPLKQIHDALDPLISIRNDIAALTAQVSSQNCPIARLGDDFRPRDCAELYVAGERGSGVYTIFLYNVGRPVAVSAYCDMETDGGGWLVFQRRQDGSENFWRSWEDYEQGFGNISAEFWQGNGMLHQITGYQSQELRIDLQDHDGLTAHAEYTDFSVGTPISKYTLTISGYSGTAGDGLSGQTGQKFTTRDSDNDVWGRNCAVQFKGAWWYKSCHSSNLNGGYRQTGEHTPTTFADTVMEPLEGTALFAEIHGDENKAQELLMDDKF